MDLRGGVERVSSLLFLEEMPTEVRFSWVVTVEPGIYIPDEGLGVRLENDLLVTADGCVDLCAHVPIEADEIESLLRR